MSNNNSNDSPPSGSTPNHTGSRNQRNNNSNNNQRNTTTNNNQINGVVHTNPHNYEGANTDVGAVIGLRHEKFKKKAPSFESFLETLSTYVVSTLKDGSDMKPLFDKMTSPFIKLNNKHKPSKPTEEADAVDMDIYKEEVKQFVTRSANLRRNREKTFGLIWGLCNNALKADIKGLEDCTIKFEDLDTLWLITALKK